MINMVIDRFDENYAFCEDDQKKMYQIKISKIPNEAKEGYVIYIYNNKIKINYKETNLRQEKIKKLQNEIFKNEKIGGMGK